MILCGSSRIFCSGADLDFVLNNMKSREAGYLYSSLMHSNMNRLRALPLVKVAAIDGYAIGGGAEIAMACDRIIMSRSAQIGFVHIKVGIVPGWSGASPLVNRCGPTTALQLMMSGQMLTGEQCLRKELIDGVIDSRDQKFINDCVNYALNMC